MNWVGDEIQKHISKKDSFLDLGCGIGQSVLDTCKSYPPTKLDVAFYHGVDVHKPYIDFLRSKGYYSSVIDLSVFPLPFPTNSYDHVGLLDFLEHFHLTQADRLIEESKRIAKKMVFVVTPNYFYENLKAVENPYPYDRFKEDNPFQRHLSFVSKTWLENRGFTVNTKLNRYLYFATWDSDT